MREDRFTNTPEDAAEWERNHFPGWEPWTPTLADLDHTPPSDEPGEPGIFADAFRKSVAEVRRIRSKQ